MPRSGLARLALFSLLALPASGCGSTATTGLDSGTLPVITVPPLVCTKRSDGCECSPDDAGEGTTTRCAIDSDADVHCCAGTDYPFAGECACTLHACVDGGTPVTSCSAPPLVLEAGPCDPDECHGSSCGGGYCCTSSCQDGACQSTCS